MLGEDQRGNTEQTLSSGIYCAIFWELFAIAYFMLNGLNRVMVNLQTSSPIDCY